VKWEYGFVTEVEEIGGLSSQKSAEQQNGWKEVVEFMMV
jgi:hypothetical protein